MKAEIKSIYSTEIKEPLTEFIPEKSENFGFLLPMIIGPKGEQGEENFDIMVCTPEWLKENNKDDEIIFGRHHLIVFKYDYQSIKKSFQNA